MIGTNAEIISFLMSQPDGRFEIKLYEEKRSLSANALYWTGLTQLAKALRVSNACMHNQLLRKYGSPLIVDGQEVFAALPDTKETERQVDEDENNHFQATQQKTKSRRWYKMLKPSHDFTTSEMSRLIDGLADEMRECGLTPPQEETIRKAIEKYERTHNVPR